MNKWYSSIGNDSDVVLFSKVRLARNLSDTPFKTRMGREIKKNTVKKLYASVKNSALAGDFNLVDLRDKSGVEAISYAEKQYISPGFAKEGGAFLLSNHENVSVMLCEEDHIRITAFAPGLNMQEAYGLADKTDNVFLESLPIAFDDKLGFLTASPINIGTGMKASVGLHLPAIKSNGGIARLTSMVGKLGLSLRPLYSNSGAFYLLTNQISLGITENAALENINAVAAQIIMQERNLREAIKNNETLEDKLYRSMGTLKMARRLEHSEFIELISEVRLGIALGLFDTDICTVGELIHTLANGTVLVDAKSENEPELAPKIRAKIIREKLN